MGSPDIPPSLVLLVTGVPADRRGAVMLAPLDAVEQGASGHSLFVEHRPNEAHPDGVTGVSHQRLGVRATYEPSLADLCRAFPEVRELAEESLYAWQWGEFNGSVFRRWRAALEATEREETD